MDEVVPGSAGWRPGWVVLGWTAFNVALIAVLALLHGTLLETVLYAAMTALVTVFGAVVLWAFARGRTGQQYRQPISSSSAFLGAVVLLLVGWGFVYHWWIALLALYPLAGLWPRIGRERLARGVTVAAPASNADALDTGGAAGGGIGSLRLDAPATAPGMAVALPLGHAAHRPPRPGLLARSLFIGLALGRRLLRRRADRETGASRRR